ncbi:MAG: DMT family transporter [Thermoplasmata archaeon]|nr:DMT family transporter [Thermoplasmata archaeon]
MNLPRGYAAAAVGLPLLAALLWASYYIFVLGITPGTRPSAVFVYPFLFGGALYTLWCIAEGNGPALARMWRQPAAYVRVAFLLGMQLSVLASTYLAGPVDTSLLSLIGDVVLTPIIVALWFVSYRGRFDSPVLWLGMALCTVGGGLAIVGNQGITALHGWGYVVLVAIPLTVALFFLATAKENERSPLSAVLAQSMFAAGLVGVALSPLLPGGFSNLGTVTAVPLLVLAITGVTSFFIAPLLYFEAIQRVGLIVPPLMMTGIPVFAALLSWGVLGIAIPWIGILGIPIAVGGAVLALRGETQGKPPETTATAPGPGG